MAQQEELKNGLVARLQNIDLDTLTEKELGILADLNDIYLRRMGGTTETTEKPFCVQDYIEKKKAQWADEEQQQKNLEARLI
ncbi:MAG: hypothetical protein IKH26_12700 [Bacteroidaceae bacterium]|nr:hypothetical protein [Bacteroidaceae bacterium]